MLIFCSKAFIRLRDNKKLDIKFNRACIADRSLPLQPYCEEYSFPVPLTQDQLEQLNTLSCELGLKPITTPSLERYLKANNFIEHYVIDKTRSSYTLDNFIIAHNQVESLGTFLEIEIMAETTDNLETFTPAMRQLLSRLNLKPLKTGYGTLLLRKQHYQHYLKSRFALEEDLKN